MNQNERYYQRIIGSIGATMLFFFLFFQIFGLYSTLATLLKPFFPPTSETAYEVVYQLLYGIGYLTVFMMPVAILRHLIRKKGLPYLPIQTKPNISPAFPLILLSGIAIISCSATVNSALVSVFQYNQFTESVLFDSVLDQKNAYQIILEFFTMCLVPGFCEEFLFRGAILTNCLPFGKTNAIMISSLLFAVMHQNVGQFFFAFAAGIILGILYERTGNIWTGTVLHTLNNLFSSAQGTMLAAFRNQLLGYTWVLIVETVLMVLGLIATVILLLRYFGKNNRMKDGFFNRSLTSGIPYAEAPIRQGSAIKLFCTPTMVLYLSFSLVSTLILLGMAVIFVA